MFDPFSEEIEDELSFQISSDEHSSPDPLPLPQTTDAAGPLPTDLAGILHAFHPNNLKEATGRTAYDIGDLPNEIDYYIPKYHPETFRIMSFTGRSWERNILFTFRTSEGVMLFWSGVNVPTGVLPGASLTLPSIRVLASHRKNICGWLILEDGLDVARGVLHMLPYLGFPTIYAHRSLIEVLKLSHDPSLPIRYEEIDDRMQHGVFVADILIRGIQNQDHTFVSYEFSHQGMSALYVPDSTVPDLNIPTSRTIHTVIVGSGKITEPLLEMDAGHLWVTSEMTTQGEVYVEEEAQPYQATDSKGFRRFGRGAVMDLLADGKTGIYPRPVPVRTLAFDGIGIGFTGSHTFIHREIMGKAGIIVATLIVDSMTRMLMQDPHIDLIGITHEDEHTIVREASAQIARFSYESVLHDIPEMGDKGLAVTLKNEILRVIQRLTHRTPVVYVNIISV